MTLRLPGVRNAVTARPAVARHAMTARPAGMPDAMTVRLAAFASLDALPAEAAGLQAANPGWFASAAWWRSVLAFGLPPEARPYFLLAWIGERAAALFPLRCDGGVLSGLTTPYTCVYAPLLAPDLTPAEQAGVFAAFARFCRGRAPTRLDALPADWPALPALLQGARQAGMAVVRFAHFGNWHEDVGGIGWSGYLDARAGALRTTIRRKLRRAEQLPDAAFAVVAGGAGLEAGIAAFEHVYARSWKQPEPFPLFNAGMMREAGAAGLLRLGLWRIGGVPVAAQLWIVEAGIATVLKLAHDEAFQAHSPGTVLTALMLRRLLDEEAVSAIDFGRGDDEYKRGWAGQRRQRIGLVLADPRRPDGLAFLARHALGRIHQRLSSRGPQAASHVTLRGQQAIGLLIPARVKADSSCHGRRRPATHVFAAHTYERRGWPVPAFAGAGSAPAMTHGSGPPCVGCRRR